ncbi:hypothetical protein HT031_004957 [Scenedesmus sp. PABB004]|nr:hypothetical protein HT031_004957 [Scenedesmus sp. PABB004]
MAASALGARPRTCCLCASAGPRRQQPRSPAARAPQQRRQPGGAGGHAARALAARAARDKQGAASSDGSSTDALIDAFNALAGPLKGIVGTPLYTGIELAVLLATLALIDAAFSGDWSRIGVITQDTETLLQRLVLVIAVLHAGTGAAAGAVAARRGRGVAAAALRGFLFGTLGVYEQTAQE